MASTLPVPKVTSARRLNTTHLPFGRGSGATNRGLKPQPLVGQFNPGAGARCKGFLTIRCRRNLLVWRAECSAVRRRALLYASQLGFCERQSEGGCVTPFRKNSPKS